MVNINQVKIDRNVDFNNYQVLRLVIERVGLDIEASPVLGRLTYSEESNVLFVGDGTNPQPVGGNLNFDNVSHIGFNTTLNNPAYLEGLIFYDKTKKTLSYYNEEADVTVNLGQESIVKVKNLTGNTITNGTVVTGLASDGGIITIQKASAQYKEKSRFIGMATQDIASGNTGYVTAFGEVGGLNTSGYAAGTVLYVSTVDGEYTTTPPDDGAYAIVLGMVVKSDTTNGSIIINPNISELTVEVTDTNGFPEIQKANTTLTVNNGSRTFSIAPVGSEFHFYVLGNKFNKVGGQSIVFDDIEGTVWFYFDNLGVLNKIHNPSPAQIADIILNKCFIAEIYWNATDNKIEFDIFDERHGISMSPKTHFYLHRTRGAQFVSGYGLGNFNLGTGNLATNSQFSVGSGEFVDEDLEHLFAGTAVGDTIDVAYIVSTEPLFRTTTQAGYAFINSPGGRVYYNQLNGSSWQLTECANNTYVLYHIFGINGYSKKVVSVVGQNNYTTLVAARAGASTEISTIKAGFAIPETVPVATYILQTRSTNVTGITGTWSRSGTVITVTSTNHKLVTGETINVTAIDGSQTTGNKVVTVIDTNTFTFTGVGSGNTTGTLTFTANAFTNATYSRIVADINGNSYTDWRTSELAQGASPTSHSNLTNVQQANMGVQDGHISDTTQTIYGAKTFNESPIVPAPTTDFQVATKKYVDDNAGGGGGASFWVTVSQVVTKDSNSQFTITGADYSLAKGGSVRVNDGATHHYVLNAVFSGGNTVVTITGTALPTITKVEFDYGAKTVQLPTLDLFYDALSEATNGTTTYQNSLEFNRLIRKYLGVRARLTYFDIQTDGNLGLNSNTASININLNNSGLSPVRSSNLNVLANGIVNCGSELTYANTELTVGTEIKLYNSSPGNRYSADHFVNIIITITV